MQKTSPLGNRADELKRFISIVEWDLPHIQNESLKAIKEEQLIQYKRELEGLLVVKSGIIGGYENGREVL